MTSSLDFTADGNIAIGTTSPDGSTVTLETNRDYSAPRLVITGPSPDPLRKAPEPITIPLTGELPRGGAEAEYARGSRSIMISVIPSQAGKVRYETGTKTGLQAQLTRPDGRTVRFAIDPGGKAAEVGTLADGVVHGFSRDSTAPNEPRSRPIKSIVDRLLGRERSTGR